MANNEQSNPDSEAAKWFTLILVTVTLYVAAAFIFVIMPHVDADTSRPEVQYGQPH
jgi:uncharacterized membrane protein SirB2